MKRFLLLTLFCTAANAVDLPYITRSDGSVELLRGIEFSKAPTCTVADFWAQVTASGLILVEDNSVDVNSPLITLSSYNVESSITTIDSAIWTEDYIAKWISPTTIPTSWWEGYWQSNLKANRANSIKSYKDFMTATKASLAASAPCLVPEGVTHQLLDAAPVGSSIDGLDAYVVTDYAAIVAAYPLKNTPPTIYAIDTLWNFNNIPLEFRPRVLPGKSFVPGYPEPVDVDAGLAYTHQDLMGFWELMASNQGRVFPIAIHKPRDVIERIDSVRGIDFAISDAKGNKQGVINMSYGPESSGNAKSNKAAITRAKQAGLDVVQAASNSDEEITLDTTYEPDKITVGFSVGGELQSAYGTNYGPDLVVPEDGTIPRVIDAVNIGTGPFRRLWSSGATAITSGIVAIMKNQCPDATFEQRKDALVSTAKKFPMLPDGLTISTADVANRKINYKHGIVNSRGGIIQAKAAIDKLMSLPICAKKHWYQKSIGAGWSADLTSQDPFVKQIVALITANLPQSPSNGYTIDTATKTLYLQVPFYYWTTQDPLKPAGPYSLLWSLNDPNLVV